jgi:hypothetical protein
MAVLGAFAAADKDLVLIEIDVLDAKGEALGEAHARAIHEGGGQALIALKLGEDGADLIAAKDDGKADGLLGAGYLVKLRDWTKKHLAEQEKQSRERLVLGGGAHLLANGELGEEGVDVPFGEGGGLASWMITKEARHPVAVGDEGPRAVMARFQGVAITLEQRLEVSLQGIA